MDFSDALKAMKAGKRIRRTRWLTSTYINYDGWIHNSLKQTMIINSEISEACFSISNGDILANDWEIFEEPPEIKVIEKYKQWLQYEIEEHEMRTNESANDGDYPKAAYFFGRKDVYENCLGMLNKYLKRD